MNDVLHHFRKVPSISDAQINFPKARDVFRLKSLPRNFVNCSQASIKNCTSGVLLRRASSAFASFFASLSAFALKIYFLLEEPLLLRLVFLVNFFVTSFLFGLLLCFLHSFFAKAPASRFVFWSSAMISRTRVFLKTWGRHFFGTLASFFVFFTSSS